MPSPYRIPILRDRVTVNGNSYTAVGNGVFFPATDADAEEMEKLGGVQADYPGAWDDLRFPAQGINPAGAADAPSVDNVLTSYPGTLLFSGSQENVIAGVAQMPHAWDRGTPVRPHIHWSKPVGSSSAVSWTFYYRHAGMVGEAAGAWVGPIAGTLAGGNPANTDEHLITSFGSIDMSSRKESSIICWQIRRAGDTDADNGQARLYEFDIHYQVSKRGTVDEIPS